VGFDELRDMLEGDMVCVTCVGQNASGQGRGKIENKEEKVAP
jgi:hypothetical protein